MNLSTHAQVIDLWPTKSAFCKAISVEYNVGRQWHTRSSIPAPYWMAVVNAAHEIDAPVTYKLLAEMIATDKKNPGHC